MISQIIFIVLAAVAFGVFAKKALKIRRNILLGLPEDRSDNKAERFKTMAMVALGQSKMVVRPIAGFFHILIYIGFVLINIEVLEIVIDGVFGTHRALAELGSIYNVAIGFFEILALLVIIACVVFITRRYISRLPRFWSREMTGWPTKDALIILVVEIVLMVALLTMNAADQLLQDMGSEHFVVAGAFPVSQYLTPLFSGMNESGLIVLERTAWWFHIIGIFLFLNYLPYSKHFHIILAFPNTYFSNLKPKGQFSNLASVTNEVKLMLDPNANPYEASGETSAAQVKFGAKDVQDLSWKSLLDAYSCTECGRCTSVCPANITGKKLSPRKIMMDTRDRLEEVGNNIDKHGMDFSDNKSLLGDYITKEELWACTTCNACAEACPINIDPLTIIVDLRRYLVMEESQMPSEWAIMTGNIENNGAPWQFSQTDRLNWADGLEVNDKN